MASPKDPPTSLPVAEPAGTQFYVTGGTLRPDAPSYVERRADRELLEGLRRGEFCYVLTSRQMGKSSLMVRTAQRLRPEGIHVVVLDLTAIGQNLTPEQWYDGLLLRLGRQLRLEEEMEQFWRTHERVGPVQRFILAIHDVALTHRAGSLVIFVDEIDAVRNLPFPTDEFFAAIRECYNRRGEDPSLRRLTFCLLGVVTPSDLIRDTRTTPFNIGLRIELTDFTEQEAETLLPGLRFGNDGREDMNESEARALLHRVLHWTGGHPYLTQRLCRAVADRNDATDEAAKKLRAPKAIDELCDELFLAARSRERDDNLLFVRERLLRSDADRASLLDLYLHIHRGRRVPDDENSPLISALRLSGVARVSRYLEVRNRIYRQVFDRDWAVANMPDPEKRRQREAFRRGALRGALVGAVALVLGVALWLGTRRFFEARAAHQALALLTETYSAMRTYQDHAEVQLDLAVEGSRVTTGGTLTLAVAKPDKLRLTADLHSGFNQIKLQVIRRGNRVWVHAPLLQSYQTWETTNSLLETVEDVSRKAGRWISELGYRFELSDDLPKLLGREAPDLGYHGRENSGRHASYVFTWHRPLGGPGFRPPREFRNRPTNGPPMMRPPGAAGRESEKIPTTAWISGRDGLINQLTTDWTKSPTELSRLAGWGRELQAGSIRELTFTTRHADIRVNDPIPEAAFEFVPPANTREVEQLDSTGLLTTRATAAGPGQKEEARAQNIPPRPPDAPPSLLDLSAYYNQSLEQRRRPGPRGSDLRSLSRGIQTLGEVRFDARGIVQLAGTSEFGFGTRFPERVPELAVGRRCRRLHFLHAAMWFAPEGTHIGSYVVHYADGEQRIIPLLYGYDIRDWVPQPDELKSATGLQPVWSSSSGPTGGPRLFLKTWENPRRDVVIKSLDFVSTLSASAPFLLAITVDEGE